jgi:uncharacterized membrane protein
MQSAMEACPEHDRSYAFFLSPISVRYALHYTFAALSLPHHAVVRYALRYTFTFSLAFDTLTAVPCSNEPALKQRA